MQLLAMIGLMMVSCRMQARALPNPVDCPDGEQPDSCGRAVSFGSELLPCCPGADDIGAACNICCVFGVCDAGIEGFCAAPPADYAGPADAKSVCVGCGAIDFPCCPGDAPGERGKCDGRAGPATCVEVDGTPMCVLCGFESEACCGTATVEPSAGTEPCSSSFDSNLTCVDGTCVADTSGGTVSRYGQCGGRAYDGPTTCAAGLECVVRDEWYSQCDQAAGGEGVPLYAQCGGIGYDGPTTCVAGAACVRSDDYYSQCQPV